jgi:undecaprenyl-diphosphatase
MVDGAQAVITGLVRGLSEFLPVGSRAHMALLQRLWGLEAPEPALGLALQGGVALAALLYLWRDAWSMLRGATTGALDDDGYRGRRLLWLMILASLPAALAGWLWRQPLWPWDSSTRLTGFMILGGGLLLALTRWAPSPRREVGRVGAGRALVVGLAQALALPTGLSRAGLALVSGLFLGLDRALAARFAFLLAIPGALGAMAPGFWALGPAAWSAVPWQPLALGGGAAALGGMLAMWLTASLARRGALPWLALYCLGLGSWALMGSNGI